MKSYRLDCFFGGGMKILVIAEAGVNHNGSLDMAQKLIDAAASAGADIVKFQTFKTHKLVTASTPMAEYQQTNIGTAGSQLEMLKSLELSDQDHFTLKEYCNRRGIEFLSTAFDEESLDFLVEKVGIQRIKIPSGELTNAPFLYSAACKGLEMIVSTGMSTPEEVNLALDFLAFGLLGYKNPRLSKVRGTRELPEGKKILLEKVTILHCTSDYPTAPRDVNLKTIQYLRDTYKTSVGFSDHSAGIVAPLASVALGVSVIEKHFTLDKSLPGPDHAASLDPVELVEMISAIRDASEMMGSYEKTLSSKEILTKNVARKFIVAKQQIGRGVKFTEENLTCKRSGGGLEPTWFFDLLGKESIDDYLPDQPINRENME